MIAALILYFLANFGFAYIVGFSKISAGVRDLLGPFVRPSNQSGVAAEWAAPELEPGALNAARYWLVSLLECPACLGAWTGAFATFYLLGWARGYGIDAPELHVLPVWAAGILGGCATSGSNFILGRLTRII